MSENRAEILTGGLVLAVAVGFLGWSMQGRSSGGAGSYELKASFRSVEGVTVGTDVRLAGVKVGTVTSLALNSKTYFADATLSVREGVVLPSDSAALISSEGLLGGSYVELQPGGSPEDYAAGDEIEDTQGSVSVITMLMKFVDGGGSSSDAETTAQ